MYKVGIVGCGRIAGGFEDISDVHPCTHIGGYRKFSEIEVVAVADVSKVSVKKFKERWNIPRAYNSYEEMLKKEKLDIISVCVPDNYHAEVVINAAKYKPKVIFCEKVMTTNIKDADAMVKACEENGVKIIVDYNRRFDPVYQKIKEIIDTGGIGEPLFIYGSHISGLQVMGTHVLDLFHFLFGEVKSVYGVEEEKALEKMDDRYSENYSPRDKPFNGLFRFKNGAIGFLAGTSRRDHEFFEIDIHGTKGRILFNDGNVIYEEKSNVYYFIKDGVSLVKTPFPRVESENLMINAITEILACIKEDRESISSGHDGLNSVKLMQLLKESYKKGCEVKL